MATSTTMTRPQSEDLTSDLLEHTIRITDQMLGHLLGGDGASRWEHLPPDEVYLRSHFLVLNTFLIMHHWAFSDWRDRRE